MNKLISTFFFISLAFNSQAGIFGADSRIETKDAPDLEQEIARSVPAFILKRSLKKLADGDYELANQKLTEMGFCAEARFSEQRQIANCSSSLIAKNKVLTAGHCLSPETKMGCEDYFIVFDYKLQESPEASQRIKAQNVYECKTVLYNVFDQYGFSEDIAIIELDRDVLDRRPVKLNLKKRVEKNDQLFMIGYPLGVFQKVVTEGEVLENKKDGKVFKHNLDSFSVNSGGPVFSRQTGEQVGILAYGTTTNMTKYENKSCYDWTLATEKDYAAANSLLHLKKTLKRLKI